MPKLSCQCGYVHTAGEIPDDGWVAVKDADYEKLVAAELAILSKRKAPRSAKDDARMHTAEQLTSRLYECPDCGSLAWVSGDGETVRFFAPLSP